jgi:hypothetical protein
MTNSKGKKIMPKKIEPLEITDTGEIPTISVDIPTDYEALLPDPVPATAHVAEHWQPMSIAPRRYENMLPIVATVLASVVTGAALIATGMIIGAGL